MLVSRPVGVLGKSFGQPALRMSIAFWLAARNSSSAGRSASVGCTTSEMRSIGQFVRSEALLLHTSAARCSERPALGTRWLAGLTPPAGVLAPGPAAAPTAGPPTAGGTERPEGIGPHRRGPQEPKAR